MGACEGLDKSVEEVVADFVDFSGCAFAVVEETRTDDKIRLSIHHGLEQLGKLFRQMRTITVYGSDEVALGFRKPRPQRIPLAQMLH